MWFLGCYHNNLPLIEIITIIGIWNVIYMWSDWCVLKAAEKVAIAKIEQK